MQNLFQIRHAEKSLLYMSHFLKTFSFYSDQEDNIVTVQLNGEESTLEFLDSNENEVSDYKFWLGQTTFEIIIRNTMLLKCNCPCLNSLCSNEL